MKSNWPTTWTNKKISSLLLLTLLPIQESQAGNAFRNCLTYDLLRQNITWDSNTINLYDALLKAKFKKIDSKWEWVYCNSGLCQAESSYLRSEVQFACYYNDLLLDPDQRIKTLTLTPITFIPQLPLYQK